MRTLSLGCKSANQVVVIQESTRPKIHNDAEAGGSKHLVSQKQSPRVLANESTMKKMRFDGSSDWARRWADRMGFLRS